MKYVEDDPLVVHLESIPNLSSTLENCLALIEEI